MNNPWREFERRCQKPDFRRVGNAYARRIARPLALYCTRVILPTGVSAHTVTLAAWVTGLAAAGAFAFGSMLGWVIGAALLQTSYLLDHIDGQIARYRRTASLDGVALDFLMHHTLVMVLPLGIGYGFVNQGGSHLWLLVGIAWSVGMLMQSIDHDVRAKAIVSRLKRLDGELRVIGGRGGRPTPPAPWPRRPVAIFKRLVRLACQWHWTINTLTVLSLLRVIIGQPNVTTGTSHSDFFRLATNAAITSYAAVMGPLALTVAVVQIVRSVRDSAAEHEFAAWYAPPEGCTLLERDGSWSVATIDEVTSTDIATIAPLSDRSNASTSRSS